MGKIVKRAALFVLLVGIPLALAVGLTLRLVAAQQSLMQSVAFYADSHQAVYGWEDGDGLWHVFLPASAGDEIRAGLPPKLEMTIDGAPVEGAFAAEYETAREIVLRSGIGGETRESAVFHRSENLPAVFIEIQDLARVHASKDNKEKGQIHIVDRDGSVAYQGEMASFSGRGSSTWAAAKKPYSIQLAQEADLFGMGAAQKWVLLANFYDEAHVRNKIVFDTAQKLGVEATASLFCDLYINGAYQGLYQLGEKIEVGPSRVDIVDLQGKTQSLNPGLLEQYPLQTREMGQGRIAAKKINFDPEDITGGYLLEASLDDRLFDDTYLSTGGGNYYLFAAPKDPSLGQAAYAQSFMQELEAAVLAADGVNPDTGRHFSEYIDLESIAKSYLLNESFVDLDGNSYSQYFYKDSDAVDPRLYGGPVWDFDLSMGNGDPVRNTHPQWLLIAPEARTGEASTLYTLLARNQPAFWSAVKRYYREELMPLLDDLVAEGIDAYAGQIRTAALLDGIRWNVDRQSIMHFEGSFDAAVEHVRTVLQQRRDFLWSLWFEDLTFHEVTVRVDHDYWDNKVAVNTFYIADGEKFSPLGDYHGLGGYDSGVWINAETGAAYDFDAPVTEDLLLAAEWERSTANVVKESIRDYMPLGYIALFFLLLLALLLWAVGCALRERGKKR